MVHPAFIRQSADPDRNPVRRSFIPFRAIWMQPFRRNANKSMVRLGKGLMVVVVVVVVVVLVVVFGVCCGCY